MNTNFFGKEILFTEVLHSILYIIDKALLNEKLITPVHDSVKIAEPKSDRGRFIYSHSFRKIVFKQEKGQGIIIGQTTRDEGEYWPGFYSQTTEDAEQATLTISKRYSFWIVATKMNKKELIPKNSEILIIDRN
jgi:hypothetical protein